MRKAIFLLCCAAIFMSSCTSKASYDAKKLDRSALTQDTRAERDKYRAGLRPHDNLSAPNYYDDNSLGYGVSKRYRDNAPLSLSAATAPNSLPIKNNRKVTLSVTEDVPLRELLVQIARLAELELALDPGIEGGIILSVRERPVSDVIEMIADLGSLRYQVENGVLKISRDSPYLENYKVDFINVVRQSQGQSNLADNILHTGAHSSHRITTTSQGDLWSAISGNLDAILSSHKVAADGTKPFYSVNKQAGLISVMAKQSQQKQVNSYLSKIKRSLSSQVLIEAKMVEVSLYDNYGAGINWRDIKNSGLLSNLNISDSDFTQGVFRPHARGKNGSILSALELIEEFGTTRVLSNPRITTLNNQNAVLTFTKNQPYFTVSGSLESDHYKSGARPVSVQSELRTVPIGLVLSLQPSINLDTCEITMNIRPTLSRIASKSTVKDPALTLLNNGLGAQHGGDEGGVPIVEIKELDTVLTVRSGDVMVLGGLIEHEDSEVENGQEFGAPTPFWKKLKSRNVKQSKVKETVILIQATIIPSSSNYHQHDKKLYNNYTQDPIPFDL